MFPSKPLHWEVAVTERDETTSAGSEDIAALEAQVAVLGEENAHLRSRLAETPNRVRVLEERLLETKGQLAQLTGQNEKLSYTLREAREHIASLRDEVDKLTQPPSAYGVVVGKNDDGTVDVLDAFALMDCMNGPDVPEPPPGCDAATFERADLDTDDDVDLHDVAAFQLLYSPQ